MSGEHLGGTEGMSEATDAFASVLEAETPSRSTRSETRKEPARQDIEDLFPKRQMDRSEREGGADEPPPRRPQPDEPAPEVDDDEDVTEDETEEDDDAPVEESAEEEPEQAEQALDGAQIVRITVDGEPMEVSLDEMAKGYIRKETFHRRLGEIDQGIKGLQQAKLELDQLHAAHVQRAEALEAYVAAFMPTEPNWDEHFRTDPTKAVQLRYQWDDFQRKLAGVRQSRAEAEAVRAQAYQERLSQFASAGRAQLAASHPEWKQEKVWRKDNDSMRRTAKAVGYTDDELRELYDPRAVEILLKAARYDRMMTAKPKPVRSSPPPLRANGATPSRNVSNAFSRAERRLSRSGSVSDAAAVFERMLDREG